MVVHIFKDKAHFDAWEVLGEDGHDRYKLYYYFIDGRSFKKWCEMSCGGTDSSVLTPNFRVNNFALCHSLSSLVWKTFCFCVVFLDIVRTFSLTLKS